MITIIKQALAIGMAALMAPLAQAALINFHFGPKIHSGLGAVGNAGDYWNGQDTTNGGPVMLKDSTNTATPVYASWTSGDAGKPSKPIYFCATGTPLEPSMLGLMGSYAESYSYFNGTPTNLTLTLSGLTHGQVYTLFLYGAGDLVGQGTAFTITGATTTWASTIGINRLLGDGVNNAYTVVQMTCSHAATITITAKAGSLSYAVLNGIQLVTGTVAAPAPTSIAGTRAPIVNWGVCGHPSFADYASGTPGNAATQMSDLSQLGANLYRVSFESDEVPAYFDKIAPEATAAGITLLPDLPIRLIPANSAQTNYSTNYTIGYTWAAYAISKGYPMPYWELGNEPENASCVTTIGDGSSPADFPDKAPGGFVAVASGLDGAYDGVRQAYADGRTAGLTTITPQVLMGMCYRHWGLLAKIENYNSGVLPCDIISWHWYGPTYGDFNAPVNAPGSADNGRSPAVCLADFKSKVDPTKPMDVWITETNRSLEVGGKWYNGSTGNLAAPQTVTGQDWIDEAAAIQGTCDSFKKATNVKGVFVYELYDEVKLNGTSTAQLASAGYYGMITGLGGTKKNAFYTYQTEIQTAK